MLCFRSVEVESAGRLKRMVQALRQSCAKNRRGKQVLGLQVVLCTLGPFLQVLEVTFPVGDWFLGAGDGGIGRDKVLQTNSALPSNTRFDTFFSGARFEMEEPLQDNPAGGALIMKGRCEQIGIWFCERNLVFLWKWQQVSTLLSSGPLLIEVASIEA